MIRKYLEDLFDEYEWRHEYTGASYTLVIPLYCARSVALDEARKAIALFAERHVPLFVQELRIPRPQRRDKQMLFVARRKNESSKPSEIPWRSVHWQIYLDRADYQDNSTLSSKEEPAELTSEGSQAAEEEILKARAARELKESKLPGETFDPSNMQIHTPVAPKRPLKDPWVESRRSVGLLIWAGFLMLLAMGGSTIFWMDLMPMIWRIIGVVVALSIAIFVGLWVTGNRRTRPPRILACVVVVTILALQGLLVGRGIESQLRESEVPFDLQTVMLILLGLTLGVFMLAGLFHSAVIYPQFRKFWSLRVLTVLFAGAFALSPAAISASLTLTNSDLALTDVPEWSHFLIALNIAAWAIGLCTLIFSILGWMAYFGITTGTLFERMLAHIMVFLIVPTTALAAVIDIFNNAYTLTNL